MNIQNQAILFAIRKKKFKKLKSKDEQKSKKEDPDAGISVEEIGQLSHMEQFVSRKHFLPIGFVPTYWEQSTKKQTVTKKTILTNNLQDLYLSMEEEIDIETQETKNTIFDGPYRTNTENDLENLLYLRRQVASKPELLDMESLVNSYLGHTIFSIFFDDEAVLEYVVNYIEDKNKSYWENIYQHYYGSRTKELAHQEDPKDLEPAMIRRLFITLTTPVELKQTRAGILNRDMVADLPTRSVIKQSFDVVKPVQGVSIELHQEQLKQ